MIIDDVTRDDVLTVLEHVQAKCALNDDYCMSCPYANHDNYNSCAFSHIPERWQLDQIGKDGDQDD